ncbi:MAG: hypothetical protein IT427_05840 [Pirellulales bacterium]|nr:hypothetical protein [Pirellulales bacterium]
MRSNQAAGMALGFLFFFLTVNKDLAAIELAKIDRAIGKLPQFQSPHPEYCLLVFGPEAAKHVWMIHDGDTLYVDRNGNGNLTEPGEAVKVTNNFPASDEFKIGSITDGPLEHKELFVYWMDAEFLRNRDPRVKALLDENPNWRMCRMNIDVEIPGQKGAGRGGRVPQSVSLQDSRGIFQFATDPKAAPIVHFGGPWEITFYSKEDWHIDQTEQPSLSVGTPGLGSGTTAYVEYQNVIPAELKPKLQVTFPQLDDAHAAVTRSYQLDRRCCGINLYGDIRIPTDIGPGTATVEISIPNWPGTTLASTTHEVKILPAPARPKLKLVSKRLIGALEHVNKPLHAREARLIDIQFSPDGKRLVAAEVPSDVVQLWDVDARKTLRTFDTGIRSRFMIPFFTVSLDWQSLFAATYRNNYL